MQIRKTTKKLKQRFRPVRAAKKTLRTKKNQRRLLLGVGLIVILGLLYALVMAVQKQNNLQEEILKNQVALGKTQEEVKGLKYDVSEKQKTIEANAKTIEEKTQKQNELEKKITELDKQVANLKSVYGGYGGTVNVNDTAYTAGNSYAPGNCTWGVKNWKANVPNFWGDANRWDDNARAAGIAVNGQPEVGAVAQTDAGWAGHVALVTAVSGNEVTIKEMNFGGLYNINTRTVSTGEFTYIHI